MDAPTAALYTAIIAGSVSLIVSIVAIVGNIYVTNRNLRHGAAREIGKIALEFKFRQLNELYGPLLHLVEQNKALARKLREGKVDPQNWRLLDYLPEVLENPQDKAIVDSILDIDSKIEELIIQKGGLVKGPTPPESFTRFLSHYKILRMAVVSKEKPRVAEFEYYPRDLDGDVKKAHEAIKREIDGLLTKHERMLLTEGQDE